MPSKKTAENGHSWTISQFPITRVKAFYLERTAECSPQTTPNECLSSWMRSLDGYAQRMSTLRVLARSLPSCSSRIAASRSEERRVGKECRYRWGTKHERQKKNDETNGS